MIELNKLSVNYGTCIAVDKVKLNIKEGEKVSVIGRSGCGKTSLLHVLGGLITDFSGQLKINHKLVNGIRRDTGIILQDDGLFPWKSVYKNIELGLLHESLTASQVDTKIKQISQELGIWTLKDKYIKALSGGEKQRVAIARALVKEPRLLLMDEPSGALDMISKENFQDLLHQIFDRHKVTSLVVTHDIEEAVFLGQRILVMEKGKIIEEVMNPYYAKDHVRELKDFYELCLKVRQVMKNEKIK